MKVCIIQPEYSTDYSRSDEMFNWELDAMDKCDESMDLIVLPEYVDIPCYTNTHEEFMESYAKYNAALISKASETAKRCNALLFMSALRKTDTGFRNTTFAFDREGNEAGYYYKQHITEGETHKNNIDSEYSYDFEEPTIIEIDGIRFGFLICYDFYFYEAFANMARYYPDIIIGCSHQRSDTHQALEMMTRFCAYNTNAYVVRASTSMGVDSPLGGCSMIVSPEGKVLANMHSEVGMTYVDIDPHAKYYKPGGYGNPLMAHHEYIEIGRRPWKYRPGGSAIARHDSIMKYPRLCAHRGFNTVSPENSMPAFGAAVALGASEIEFDLWPTKDGEIVSLHDPVLDRVSNGSGNVWDYTLEELKTFDFGIKSGAGFEGLKIVTFEEILQKFSSHVVMNIHLKTKDNFEKYSQDTINKIVSLINKYDCKKYVYFMTGNSNLMAQLRELAPDITRCMGAGEDAWNIVDNAIKYECKKVQLFKPYYNREMIDKAHAHGIICNVFWSDEPSEAQQMLDMGIDVILTNDYQRMSNELDIK